ncbi:sugar-binding transcriptional regulator [Ensifer soli]|uniref:sugar-binding transcriptional regulator n=1 Tax=Ciceribacter sp. sgz301302 TaxID=3342379 RepID=UPI0035B79222
MATGGGSTLREEEASLATRAAWLHYAGGLTQTDVAKRLGITSLKAHRLITRANQEGLVKVFIDGEVSDCVALEQRLIDRYGLDYCEVVPDFDSDDLPLKALGIAGAQFLKREIEREGAPLIGMGHGRTLAALANQLPRMQSAHVRFVSLLGGLTRKFSANPHDVIHRLADRTGADAYVIPVPFFANTLSDRAVLFSQRGVREIMDLAATADLFVVGIGTTGPEASLVATGMIGTDEIEAVRALGGVGELLGHFFTRDGALLETPLSGLTFTLTRDALAGRRVVAVAGGRRKAPAIHAVLCSGLLKGLVTDERTASALVSGSIEDETASAAGPGGGRAAGGEDASAAGRHGPTRT